jgi:hypothetical protein
MREVVFMEIVTITAPQKKNPLIYSSVTAGHLNAGEIHTSPYLYFNSMKSNESDANVTIARGVFREFTVSYLSSA